MRRPNRAWRLYSLLALVAANACATRVAVDVTVTPGTDFSRYATYLLVAPQTPANDAIRKRLEVEIAEELEGRGYRAAPRSQADLLVAFQGSTAHGERRTWSESPGGCCVVESYVAGTLVIEVFTAREQDRIWRGVGTVDLPNERDLADAASRAAEAILADFPKKTTRDSALLR